MISINVIEKGYALKTSQSLPGSIILSTDAGNPDTDGKWTLNWTESAGAQYYNIYYANSEISNIKQANMLPENYSSTRMVGFRTEYNGEHYYIAVAVNDQEYILSNQVHVSVKLSETGTSDEEQGNINDGSDFIIPPFVYVLIIIGILAFVSFTLILKLRASRDDEPTLN